MTADPKPAETDEALKRAVVDIALNRAVFDGFSERALAQAAGEAGIDEVQSARLFPYGVASLIEAFSTIADHDMENRLAALDIASMRVRERIATAIATRLAVLKPHKEAARRATAMLSLPIHVPLAATLLYRTVDAMWRAVGDTSTDFNFYTKRGILAGVYSSTLIRWFNDHSEDGGETSEFLAARIENVMQFERVKARLRDGFAQLFPRLSG